MQLLFPSDNLLDVSALGPPFASRCHEPVFSPRAPRLGRNDGDGRESCVPAGFQQAGHRSRAVRNGCPIARRSFEFSLDPGTGPIKVNGQVDGSTITIAVITSAGTRTEQRKLDEPPMLAMNLSRRLADEGLVPGSRHRLTIFDPATLRNAPVTVDVGRREVRSEEHTSELQSRQYL